MTSQLADFLTPRLDKGSGMMALPDMYCLFNRARGTELISPDDLLSAAKLFPVIGARLSFRQFPSGVLVVQSNAHLDDQVSRSSTASLLNPFYEIFVLHRFCATVSFSGGTKVKVSCGLPIGLCQDWRASRPGGAGQGADIQ